MKKLSISYKLKGKKTNEKNLNKPVIIIIFKMLFDRLLFSQSVNLYLNFLLKIQNCPIDFFIKFEQKLSNESINFWISNETFPKTIFFWLTVSYTFCFYNLGSKVFFLKSIQTFFNSTYGFFYGDYGFFKIHILKKHSFQIKYHFYI